MAFRSSSSAAIAVFVVAVSASADELDADALVQQGIELRREQRDVEALAVFRRAFELSPTPRTRAQIALAEQALAKWVDAERDLRAALEHADDPWIAKNVEVLRGSLKTIEEHLATVRVEGPPGASVRVNGAAVGTLPLAPVRVVAGTVHLELEAKGYERATRTVDAPPGTTAKESFTLVAAPESPIVAPTPREPESHRGFLLGAGLLGVGVTSLAVGTWFGIRTFERKGERDEHCGPLGCDALGLAADREARDAAMVSTITFSIGLVATTVGTIVLLRTPSRDRVTVSPVAGPGIAALSLVGAW